MTRKLRLSLILLPFICLSASHNIWGQSGDAVSELEEIKKDSSWLANGAPSLPDLPSSVLWQDLEFVNTLMITLFTFLLLVLLLLTPKSKTLSSRDFIRLIAIILLVFASLFLISAGWDSKQTAPAFGILGTIAGYLLGQQSLSRSEEQSQ